MYVKTILFISFSSDSVPEHFLYLHSCVTANMHVSKNMLHYISFDMQSYKNLFKTQYKKPLFYFFSLTLHPNPIFEPQQQQKSKYLDSECLSTS